MNLPWEKARASANNADRTLPLVRESKAMERVVMKIYKFYSYRTYIPAVKDTKGST